MKKNRSIRKLKIKTILRGDKTPDFSNHEFNSHWASELRNRLKQYDQKNGMDFDLTTDWIKEQFEIDRYSHYSGIEMFPTKTKFYPFQPSIERIDNSKGHTMDNCVLCCFAENYGRNNMNYDDFKEWLNINFPKKVDNIVKIKIKKSSPIKLI